MISATEPPLCGSDVEQCMACPRPSYTLQTWHRLKSLCQALRQTEDKVRSLKSEIEAKLKSAERLREKRAELQACQMSVQTLETQLEWRRTNARTTAARLTKTRHRAADYQVRMKNFSAEIEEMRVELADRQRLYIGVREKLIWAAAQLFMRRRQMVQELREIFFIDSTAAVSNSKSSGATCNCKVRLKIVNVHLPDAEDYYGHNDIELSVGSCFVLQALTAISRIFDFSLRYRFEFFGSRSTVCDLINPHLPPNQRTFPLYSRNQDKLAFQYGVFLLNKNIAQLRCDSGTFTQDLRCTLGNLHSLFEHLVDAKLEPYLYITRAMRLANDGAASTASTSFQPGTPSTSSGAPSTDSGERGFQLEIPTNKLAKEDYGTSSASEFKERTCGTSYVLAKPDYSADGDDQHGAADNTRVIPSSSNGTPALEDEYAGRYSVENLNGNSSAAVQKKNLLQTCYLTSDDEEQISQQDPHEETNGEATGNVQEYLSSAQCQSYS